MSFSLFWCIIGRVRLFSSQNRGQNGLSNRFDSQWKGIKINTMAKEQYSARDILVVKGLEAVRLRPAMYIGSTTAKGLHHLVWEIVDNAVDEAINGYANSIKVTINADGSISISDNGRGMPVDIHPEMKIPAVDVIFTVLHAGGKFNYDNYSYSGGLHGVGASVVNALSEWLEVDVYRDGTHYKQRYESVENKKGQITSGKPVLGLQAVGPTKLRGTTVTFKPDARVFDTIEFSIETISKRLREIAYLNSGLHIQLKDLRTQPVTEENYCFAGGIRDFVAYLNAEKTPLFKDCVYISGERAGVRVEAAFQYNDSYSENVFSYVNNIATTEGGTHETGFKSAITKVMNDFVRRFGMLKEKDENLTGDDVREGITAILSIKMRDVQFEGQTKERLTNAEARSAVDAIVTEEFTKYIESREHYDIAKAIAQKSIEAAQARIAEKKAKTRSANKNSLESAAIVGKLASCTGRNKEINELYIVEGNSAGGTAKQGRDRNYQAILPLRGKPLNVEKTKLSAVIQNEEYRTIIAALGTGIGDKFDIAKLNYDKIIILSDADTDGAHIRAILTTFFYRYMRPLIKEGHVYIGLSPLYKVTKGKDFQYAYDDEELLKIVGEYDKNYTIQRYKGLGEMNPEQLWETTLDPASRRMVRIELEDAAEAEKKISVLMGDKADARHDYITKYANFNKRDMFEDMAQ